MYGAHLRAARTAATNCFINLNRDGKLSNLHSTNNLYRTKEPRRGVKHWTRDAQAI
jgi:hypothetical protein